MQLLLHVESIRVAESEVPCSSYLPSRQRADSGAATCKDYTGMTLRYALLHVETKLGRSLDQMALNLNRSRWWIKWLPQADHI